MLFRSARGTGSTTGVLGRIASTTSGAPSISQQPASATVSSGAPATFSVTASGTAPLTYRWQRNGSDIPGATSAAYTLPSATLADSGATFRCIVANGDGSVTSSSATLTVVANTAPVATITSPAVGTTYRAGDTITFAGSATDAQDEIGRAHV